MAKRTKPPTRHPVAPSYPGAADEARAYRDKPDPRYAPYDNLYDAIRADVAELGGLPADFKPLEREYHRSPLYRKRRNKSGE